MSRVVAGIVVFVAVLGAALSLILVGVSVGRGFTASHDASPDKHMSPETPMGEKMGYPGGEHMGGMGMDHHGMAVNSEREFLVEMIPHHEEAIDRAGDLLDRSNREEMRQFARDIIDVQSAEVETMKGWLAERYPGESTDAAYKPMMRDLSGLSGDELDRAFLEDMIPHHMTAVIMSESFVSGDFVENADVVPFAERIRNTQFQEILMMEQWLPQWFGPDAAYRHHMGSMRHWCAVAARRTRPALVPAALLRGDLVEDTATASLRGGAA